MDDTNQKKNGNLGKSLLAPTRTGTTPTSSGLKNALTGAASNTSLTMQKPKTANVATVKALNDGAGYLGYVIDATGSRERSWEKSSALQNRIFENAGKSGDLHARVIHFGGNAIGDSGWKEGSADIVRYMNSVSCKSGSTQIYESFHRLLDLPQGNLPRNIILIGDCCEGDDIGRIDILANQLAERGIKVFAFHEDTPGYDSKSGEEAFSTLAKKTGGAFQKLSATMQMEELCEAVAVYTAGGAKALAELAKSSKAASLIQNQIKLRLGC